MANISEQSLAPATDHHVSDQDLLLLQAMGLEQSTELFRSPDGKSYAIGDFGRGREAVAVGSDRFMHKVQLHRLRRDGEVPKREDVRKLQGVCQALAYEKPPRAVNMRVAEQEGKLYLDLADEKGLCVEVGPDGWTVRNDSPIPFYRPKSMGALPVPTAGGTVEDLKEFINVSTNDLQLITAFMLAVLNPKIPSPALILVGEPGSAKTTTARIIKMLVDPSVGSGSPLPASERDLAIAASQDMALYFDNVAGISNTGSDMLCRVITGAGYRTRKLYTDDDQAIFEVRRPVIMTAVDNPVARVDLASRSLVIEPPRLTNGGRRDEQDIYREFEKKRPAILGALLSLLSNAMAVADAKPLKGDFRMMDFAKFAVRVEQAASWPEGSMERLLYANAANMREDMVEANVVSLLLLYVADTEKVWTGTAGKLFQLFSEIVPEERFRELPTNLAALTRKIMEIAPLLRERGIEITKTRTGAARLITVRKVDHDQAGEDGQDGGDAVTQ